MPTLRLLTAGAGTPGHGGEVTCCVYTVDGSHVLSGGWDGHLRLWSAADGTEVASLRASDKPLSACATTPDGKMWLSGALDGMLAHWDPVTHRRLAVFLAHGRPISAIVHAPDGRTLTTASWDRQLIVWDRSREREGQALKGHRDIVAGCRYTPDSRWLLSWSYDTTVRLWDLLRPQRPVEFVGHSDRVTVGAISPDGCWAASGSRNGQIKLWDLQSQQEAATATVGVEVRGLFFLLDGVSLVSVDGQGRLVLHSVPELREHTELRTGQPVQCGELAPSGSQLALGGSEGQVRLVAVDGFDSQPLAVTATQTRRPRPTMLQRLFGKTDPFAYHCICPVCRQAFEVPSGKPGQPAPCPNCRRSLRVGVVTVAAEEA